MAKFLREISVEFDFSERDEHGRESIPPGRIPVARLIDGYAGLMEAMYQHYCIRAETKGVAKVVISPSEKRHRTLIENMFDVIVVNCPFNVRRFVKADDLQRKRMMLDLIQRTLLGLARRYKWDPKPFRKTYDEVWQRNFNFREHWKTPVRSPDRKKTAQIYFEFDAKEMRVFLEVKHDNMISRVQYATSEPSYDELLSYFVGPVRWLNNNRIQQITFYKLRSILVAKRVFSFTRSGLKIVENKVF